VRVAFSVVLFSFVVVMGLEPAVSLYVTVPETAHEWRTALPPVVRHFLRTFQQCDRSGTEHAMINAASQKRALRAIPKFVFGLVLCFGLAFAAPMLWAYVPSVFWH
jgi:hypothetical protein